MFFRKNLLVKRGASRRVTISNFAGGIDSVSGDDFVGTSTSRLSYNVNGESGVLRENKGVRVFGLPLDGVETPVTAEGKKIKKVWYFRRFNSEANRTDDRILFLSYDNHLYGVSTSGGKVEKITETAFCEEPKAVNYRLKGKDVMIFCSAADDMKVYDGNTLTVVENAPKVDCACLHYDRLFVTTLNDKNTIMFSDDLDPTGWEVGPDEAGYITMTDERGAIVGIISFLNYLYVFREYGISRLTAYGAQESFNLNHLFLTTGKIVKDTVRVCGETVIFLTEQGLFQFDGSNAKKILSNLDGLFEGCDNDLADAAIATLERNKENSLAALDQEKLNLDNLTKEQLAALERIYEEKILSKIGELKEDAARQADSVAKYNNSVDEKEANYQKSLAKQLKDMEEKEWARVQRILELTEKLGATGVERQKEREKYEAAKQILDQYPPETAYEILTSTAAFSDNLGSSYDQLKSYYKNLTDRNK